LATNYEKKKKKRSSHNMCVDIVALIEVSLIVLLETWMYLTNKYKVVEVLYALQLLNPWKCW